MMILWTNGPLIKRYARPGRVGSVDAHQIRRTARDGSSHWSVTAAGELLGGRSLVHLHSYTLRLLLLLWRMSTGAAPARDRRTPGRAQAAQGLGANRILNKVNPRLLADEVAHGATVKTT